MNASESRCCCCWHTNHRGSIILTITTISQNMMPLISSSILQRASDLANQFKQKTVELFTNTTTTKRDAIVRHHRRGHQFEATYLAEPTKCSICNQRIWIPHGQKCKLCKFSSHSKCLSRIETRCVVSTTTTTTTTTTTMATTSAADASQDLRLHEFENLELRHHDFSGSPKPNKNPLVLCDHCGEGIPVLFLSNSYECLQCSRIFHEKCFKFLPLECQERRSSISHHEKNSIDTKKNQQLASDCYEHTRPLSIEDFELLGVLGKGSFSTVYLAKLRRTKTTTHGHGRQRDARDKFAIKAILKTNSTIMSDPKSAFTEWRALNIGRSYQYLTQGHCCFQSKERLFFVMEYVQGWDLLYYLEKEGAFEEDRTRYHAAEIVLALMFLHRKYNLVYRDLKPNNILLDPFGHCKLIDFGMAKFLAPSRAQGMRTSTFCGTPCYMSPELLSGQPYDFSVDWWSLGVLIYEMLCGSVPFAVESDNLDDLFEAIKTKEPSYREYSRLSVEAKSILDGLLTKDPGRRLGCRPEESCAVAIKKHPFFLFKPKNSPKCFMWNELELRLLAPPYIPCEQSVEQKSLKLAELTPVCSQQLEEVCQEAFDNFSCYNESFLEDYLSEIN